MSKSEKRGLLFFIVGNMAYLEVIMTHPQPTFRDVILPFLFFMAGYFMFIYGGKGGTNDPR